MVVIFKKHFFKKPRELLLGKVNQKLPIFVFYIMKFINRKHLELNKIFVLLIILLFRVVTDYKLTNLTKKIFKRTWDSLFDVIRNCLFYLICSIIQVIWNYFLNIIWKGFFD